MLYFSKTPKKSPPTIYFPISWIFSMIFLTPTPFMLHLFLICLIPPHPKTHGYSHANTNTHTHIQSSFCKKNVKIDKMRQHVGGHIIRNDIDVFSCGFCGGSSGCSVNFKKTTHHTFIPTSNCKMYKKFSLKSAMTSTTNTPCTNRPVKCDCCSVVYWSYALEKHYKEKHPESECTEIVSEKEKDTMMKCI